MGFGRHHRRSKRLRKREQRPMLASVMTGTLWVVIFSAVLLVAAAAWAGDGGRIKRKEPSPPKWSARVIAAFFENALAELDEAATQDGETAAGAGERMENTVETVVDGLGATPALPEVDGEDAGAAQQGGWSELVSAEVLEDEIKDVARDLSRATRSVGTIRRERLDVIRRYRELAVLFGVIAEYDGDVRWAADAAAVRDALARTALGLEEEAEDGPAAARAMGRAVADIVGGNAFDGEVTATEVSWPDVSGRSALMQRLEMGQQERIGAWTADEVAFRRDRGALAREAAIWSVLAQVIGSAGYDYAEDEEYRSYLAAFAEACRALVEASAANDLEGAQAGGGGD